MELLKKWTLLHECSAVGMIRYTKKARAVVFYAYGEANRERSEEITAEHLLIGVIRADEALANHCRLSIEQIRKELAKAPGTHRRATGVVLGHSARHAIVLAAEERERLGHKHTGTEHLLLGVSGGNSDAATALEKRGLTTNRLHELLTHRRLAERGESALIAQFT